MVFTAPYHDWFLLSCQRYSIMFPHNFTFSHLICTKDEQKTKNIQLSHQLLCGIWWIICLAKTAGAIPQKRTNTFCVSLCATLLPGNVLSLVYATNDDALRQARAQTFWGAGAETKKRAPNAPKEFWQSWSISSNKLIAVLDLSFLWAASDR